MELISVRFGIRVPRRVMRPLLSAARVPTRFKLSCVIGMAVPGARGQCPQNAVTALHVSDLSGDEGARSAFESARLIRVEPVARIPQLRETCVGKALLDFGAVLWLYVVGLRA